MRYFLTLCFLAMLADVSAQNWKPVQSDDRYLYYLDGHGFDSTAAVLEADSMSVTGIDSTFYLNRVVRRTTTIGADVRRINQPQFLQREIVYHNDGTFQCTDTATLVFLAFAPTGATWLYDTAHGISAEIISVQLQTVFAATDSVKVLALSSGDTIVLSKNHGLLRFPSGINGLSYRLAGITGRSLGIQIPGFYDLFSALQPGDILEYRVWDGQNNYPTPGNYTARRLQRDSILSKSITLSSATINVYRERNDTVTTYSGTVISANSGNATDIHYNYPAGGYDRTANNGLYTAPDFLQYYYYDSSSVFQCKTLVRANHYVSNFITYPDDSTQFETWYTGQIWRMNDWGIYGEGVGMIYYQSGEFASAHDVYHTYQLIYARINGVEYGSQIFLAAPAQSAAAPFVLYPNPAMDYVTYSTPFGPEEIQVLDETGRVCIAVMSDNSGVLDISMLAPGIYIFTVGGHAPTKLVKQ